MILMDAFKRLSNALVYHLLIPENNQILHLDYFRLMETQSFNDELTIK